MDQSVSSGVRMEGGGDPIRSFLVEKGKLDPELGGERDDRVYNAAMSCIELSLRPYERRLLNRAIHDAERLESLIQERPFENSASSPPILFSQPEFREFLSIIEREVQHAEAGGPVPALFKSGALLVAASYLWEQDQSLSSIQMIRGELRASLRLLEDLLNWVETGKRGDRIETLQEAQTRLDSMKNDIERQQSTIRQDLQRIAVGIEDLRNEVAMGKGNENSALQDLGNHLQEVDARVARLAETPTLQPDLETHRLAVETRLAAISESTNQIVGAQREIAELLRDESVEEGSGDERGLASSVDQLRSLMLIGLVGIAVVMILVVVAITVG